MSVQSLGHFIVRMTVDFKMLRTFVENSPGFLPEVQEGEEVPSDILDAFGDLSPREIGLINAGDWNKMFEYLEAEGPKPIVEDQLNYP